MPDQPISPIIGPEKKSFSPQEQEPRPLEQNEIPKVKGNDRYETAPEMPSEITYPALTQQHETEPIIEPRIDRTQESDVRKRIDRIFSWHKIGAVTCSDLFSTLDANNQHHTRSIANQLHERLVHFVVQHPVMSSREDTEVHFHALLTEGDSLRKLFLALRPELKKNFIEQEIKCLADTLSEELYPELYADNNSAIAA